MSNCSYCKKELDNLSIICKNCILKRFPPKESICSICNSTKGRIIICASNNKYYCDPCWDSQYRKIDFK